MHLYEQLELPRITWSTPVPRCDNLYLGIDNTQPNAVRVFALASDGLSFGLPIGGRRFKDRDSFLAWWEKKASQRHPAGLSTTKTPRDPFGCLGWLEAQGQYIRRYNSYDLTEGFLDCASSIPRRLKVAYSLALRVAYESEVKWLVDDLHRDLSYLRDSLKRMERQFQLVQSVIPCPF